MPRIIPNTETVEPVRVDSVLWGFVERLAFRALAKLNYDVGGRLNVSNVNNGGTIATVTTVTTVSTVTNVGTVNTLGLVQQAGLSQQMSQQAYEQSFRKNLAQT